MKIIGLTGGIGSGKTTVANYFKECGIPVYNADLEAKKVVFIPDVKQKIIALLGDQSFVENAYNTSYVAQQVFKNSTLLQKLNAIIHPAVALNFENWVKQQNAPYVLKEAAILFESGGYKQCDQIILVIASKKTRTRRVVERDQISEEEVHLRMKSQWDDEQKIQRSDYIIYNDSTLNNLKIKVFSLHKKLSNTFL